MLRVLGTNCLLDESEFRLCPEVVLGWFPQSADRECARLAEVWLGPVALCRTFDRGWVVCLGLSVFVPIGLHSVYGCRPTLAKNDLCPACMGGNRLGSLDRPAL